MVGELLYDCREMFRYACAFCECADIVMEKSTNKQIVIGDYDIPAGVNSAFACEVFLKAILKLKQIDYKKEHDLKTLFSLLPTKIYNEVKSGTANNFGGMWVNAFGVEFIDNVSKAFVEWRYIYEHNFLMNGSVCFEHGFLWAFRNTLRESCCQMLFRKTWEEYSKGEK